MVGGRIGRSTPFDRWGHRRRKGGGFRRGGGGIVVVGLGFVIVIVVVDGGGGRRWRLWLCLRGGGFGGLGGWIRRLRGCCSCWCCCRCCRGFGRGLRCWRVGSRLLLWRRCLGLGRGGGEDTWWWIGVGIVAELGSRCFALAIE